MTEWCVVFLLFQLRKYELSHTVLHRGRQGGGRGGVPPVPSAGHIRPPLQQPKPKLGKCTKLLIPLLLSVIHTQSLRSMTQLVCMVYH